MLCCFVLSFAVIPDLCRESVYGVYAGENKIGRLVLRLGKRESHYVLSTDFSVVLRTAGGARPLYMREEKSFAAQRPYRLQRIVHQSNLKGDRTAWEAEVKGSHLVVKIGGSETRTTLPTVTLRDALGASLFVRDRPRVGQKASGGSMTIVARGNRVIDGNLMETYTVEEDGEANVYLQNGELLVGRFAGLLIKREYSKRVPEILLDTRVAVAGRRAPPGAVSQAIYVLPETDPPGTNRQKIVGRVGRRVLLEVKRGSWPDQGGGPEGVSEEESPTVKALAASLGGNASPREKVGVFARWIGSHVAPKDRPGTLPAAEILRVREGDCSEKAELLAAFMRASGIPARQVGGLLWNGEAFCAHAWCEILADEPTEIDPETGEPVDARFLLLWRRIDEIRLLPLFGQRIDVLSWRSAASGG